MEAELKEIERLVILNDGNESFDTWGNDTRSMLFFFLINNFKEKGFNYFSGNKGRYIVYFRNGSDSKGCMHMGSPDDMVVKKVNERTVY